MNNTHPIVAKIIDRALEHSISATGNGDIGYLIVEFRWFNSVARWYCCQID